MLLHRLAPSVKALSDFADKQPGPGAQHNVKHDEKAVAK